MSWVRRAYRILPWGIIVLGVLHMAATFRIHGCLTPAALWFFSGGLVLVFTGALNLINGGQAGEVPALRRFCQAVNVVVLCFTMLSGIVGGATAVELLIVVGLIGATTALSFVPSVRSTSTIHSAP
jgi:hypothetical protein